MLIIHCTWSKHSSSTVHTKPELPKSWNLESRVGGKRHAFPSECHHHAPIPSSQSNLQSLSVDNYKPWRASPLSPYLFFPPPPQFWHFLEIYYGWLLILTSSINTPGLKSTCSLGNRLPQKADKSCLLAACWIAFPIRPALSHCNKQGWKNGIS